MLQRTHDFSAVPENKTSEIEAKALMSFAFMSQGGNTLHRIIT